MNIAIIPARKGSKRIKNKNFKIFFNKPMIYWTINKLKKSNLFKSIIISSNSKKILQYARKNGCDILIKRPENLSDDKTSTIETIKHAIKKLNLNTKKNIRIFCVYPCNPLLQLPDLKQSINKLKKNSNKFIFPVAISQSHKNNLIFLNKSKNVKYIKSFNYSSNREKNYLDAGQFYLANLQTWKKFSNIHKNGHCLEIPEWRAVDINYPSDWKKAEAIFRYLNHVS